QNLEAELTQYFGNVGRVVLRISQRVARILVVRIADYECDAPLGQRRVARERRQQQPEGKSERDNHSPDHLSLLYMVGTEPMGPGNFRFYSDLQKRRSRGCAIGSRMYGF